MRKLGKKDLDWSFSGCGGGLWVVGGGWWWVTAFLRLSFRRSFELRAR